MTRLKPYLKNSVKVALLFSLFSLLIISFYGCEIDFSPTYKRKDIPKSIEKICKQDYDLNIKTTLIQDTLWVYVPLDHYLLDAQGQLDKKVSEKTNNVLSTINRVILSSDNPPQFYALVISDIKEKGADYMLISYIEDLQKYVFQSVSREEFFKRFIYEFRNIPEALGDKDGKHIEVYDIYMPIFLLEQIRQRSEMRFFSDELIKDYELASIQTDFVDGTFKFYIDFKKIGALEDDIDIIDEALKIFSSVVRDYDFTEFSHVEIHDTNSGKQIRYGKDALNISK